MNKLCLVLFVSLPLLLAGQPSVVLPPDLARVLSDYQSAWTRKDSAALSQLFAEDGFVMAPGHAMVRSRPAIERFYRGQGGPLYLRAVAFAAEGNTGYILGAFTNSPGASDRGKFTLTLRKHDSGRWLIVLDMDNGNH